MYVADIFYSQRQCLQGCTYASYHRHFIKSLNFQKLSNFWISDYNIRSSIPIRIFNFKMKRRSQKNGQGCSETDEYASKKTKPDPKVTNMKERHENAAPYHIFYSKIEDSPETHDHPLSITFKDLLDPSLGKLKCSLHTTYYFDLNWLMQQYADAGYGETPLTLLYGKMRDENGHFQAKSTQYDSDKLRLGFIKMDSIFHVHHIKLSIFHYEDDSIRLLISSANFTEDDWKNKTQGFWLSPPCHRLPEPSDATQGESETGFKTSLMGFLDAYMKYIHLKNKTDDISNNTDNSILLPYMELVKKTDFSHIKVFFVASVPGSYEEGYEWGLSRVHDLLSKHCSIPTTESDQWDLIAQASSIGRLGKRPNYWLDYHFKSSFCSTVEKCAKQPEIKLIYPSQEQVNKSHDPETKFLFLDEDNYYENQIWLYSYLHEWSASHFGHDEAIPHMKSYLRLSPDGKKVAFFLLTSANVSKAAWGSIDYQSGESLKINSFEAGVLFLPKFIIGKDYFSVELSDNQRLPVLYDLPPIKYEKGINPRFSQRD